MKESGIIPTMARKPGDEDRLWTLHYSQIAKWVGLAVPTVRTYSAQGQFDRRSIESVLRWVNSRRARAGLSLIGDPDSSEDLTNKDESADPLPLVASGGYNPRKGKFE